MCIYLSIFNFVYVINCKNQHFSVLSCTRRQLKWLTLLRQRVLKRLQKCFKETRGAADLPITHLFQKTKFELFDAQNCKEARNQQVKWGVQNFVKSKLKLLSYLCLLPQKN